MLEPTWEKAVELGKIMSRGAGRVVGAAEAVHEGLQALEVALVTGIPVSLQRYEAMVRDRITLALAQYIARTQPKKQVVGFEFEETGNVLFIRLRDDAGQIETVGVVVATSNSEAAAFRKGLE